MTGRLRLILHAADVSFRQKEDKLCQQLYSSVIRPFLCAQLRVFP